MVADPTKLDECQLPRVDCVTDTIMCMCVYIGSLPMQFQPIQSVMSSWIASHQRLIIDKKKRIGGHSSPPSIKRLSPSHQTPFPFLPNSIILRTILDPPKSSSNPTTPTPFSFLYAFPFPFPFLVVLPSLIFSAALLSLRLLPQDLPLRWHRLLVFSEEAESAAAKIPSHVWRAVVACEDRRFFSHCGIDLIGIWRAILLFPAGGGGSTITQQLVKNVFLKHERKFSRKIVEMVLALMLETKLSKWKILCSYLSKIYWGHGMYGIESASAFYFGKHPSFLSLAESAMLAGIIPSPERRSPLREPSRGKIAQARALRRMVEAGFLDIETALLVVNQPLRLRFDEPEHANGPSCNTCSFGEEAGESKKKIGKTTAIKQVWNWEKASAVWEVREDMEKWALRIQKRNSVIMSIGKSN